MKEVIISSAILACIILYYVIDYQIWLRKHKKSMKQFKVDLEEGKWREENGNKSTK